MATTTKKPATLRQRASRSFRKWADSGTSTYLHNIAIDTLELIEKEGDQAQLKIRLKESGVNAIIVTADVHPDIAINTKFRSRISRKRLHHDDFVTPKKENGKLVYANWTAKAKK